MLDTLQTLRWMDQVIDDNGLQTLDINERYLIVKEASKEFGTHCKVRIEIGGIVLNNLNSDEFCTFSDILELEAAIKKQEFDWE